MNLTQKTIASLAVSFLVLISYPANILALTNNGYDVSANAKYKKKKSAYKIWGTVSGGEECDELGVHLVFVGQGKNVGFEKDIKIKNYQPVAEGVEFSTKEKSPTGSKKDSITATKVIVQCKP